MIETTATSTITCDKCGRVIAAGEEWFQVQQSITSGTFDGTTAVLSPVSEQLVQLCQDDYKAGAGALGAEAPLAPVAATAVTL